MKIAIYGKHFNEHDAPVIQAISNTLARHDASTFVEPRLMGELVAHGMEFPGSTRLPAHDIDADMVLSLGGDGTFLRTAALIGNRQTPILGINTGRLGFLTDIAGDDIAHDLDRILQGNYRIETRSLLQVAVNGEPHLSWPYALNETAISKQDSSSMISIRMAIGGEFFNTYQADGLVIATPTGSTAYALSAGGPILMPQSANWVIVPVAPHSFTVRPLVVNDDVVITLTVTSRSGNFLLSCDGRSTLLDTQSEITLRKAPFGVNIVKALNHSFSQTLRSKLMWGADKRL